MSTQIIVENLKCNGCATTIRKELARMEGVSSVTVDVETSSVQVELDDAVTLVKVKAKLLGLGYPEINAVHGISKIAAGAKSYVSCAVGKLS